MPLPAPDPSLQPLLDQLKSLVGDYPYSTLLINVPSSIDTQDLFSELCLRALREPKPHDRLWILETLKGKTGLSSAFLGYMYTAADKLRETKDIRWLEVGLGASILQDGYPDWRDYILALANLYVTAEEAGLDPRPAFTLIGYGKDDDFGQHAVVIERRRNGP